MSQTSYDVAIIGGGPVGSTVASLLKKYNPDLSVLIVEKEKFPRDHVGESQLPSVSPILDEMGVWDKVEAHGFPIKLGASYTWGKDFDRWDFDFYPVEDWRDEPRPAKFEGQRRYTAFQVDRAEYDDLLLRHAESMGAEVREEVQVTKVLTEGQRVTGFVLDTGETITAKYYIDGSGVVGFLRRALGVEVYAPEELRNVAIWDYWQNAEWAVEIGVGATRVQVRSLGYGWIWFIPLGPTRTSIGLICPAEYYKSTGLTTEELYSKALAEQPEIAALIANAQREGPIQSCKDWSQLADQLVGENWFICGEAAGFADPILAAGLSLAHSSAREAAYAILELERGELDPAWVRERFNDRNRKNIQQHIRFAQFWYSANGCFTDIKDHCQKIASEAGLRLTPKQAWRWLSQGGFTTESAGLATIGSFDLASAKQVLELFDERGRSCDMRIDGHNVFELNLRNATKEKMGVLADGRIQQMDAYTRAGSTLPVVGFYGTLIEAMGVSSDIKEIHSYLTNYFGTANPNTPRAIDNCLQALEVLVEEGWVIAKVNKKRPKLSISLSGSRYLRSSTEGLKAAEARGEDVHFKIRI